MHTHNMNMQTWTHEHTLTRRHINRHIKTHSNRLAEDLGEVRKDSFSPIRKTVQSEW